MSVIVEKLTELSLPIIEAEGFELVRLRINDVDFDHGQIRVWNGNGGTHRMVTLANELRPFLRRQIQFVRTLLEEDQRQPDYAGAWLPSALARKYRFAAFDLGWHYLFPSLTLSCEPGTGKLRRHHVDESTFGKAIRK